MMPYDNVLLLGIIIICAAFIIINVVRRRPDLIMDFAKRICVGTAGIYLLDFAMRMGGYDIHVGINGVTMLSNGLLGLPGFILLYGLAFYYSF